MFIDLPSADIDDAVTWTPEFAADVELVNKQIPDGAVDSCFGTVEPDVPS
jgi:hypothetical protein